MADQMEMLLESGYEKEDFVMISPTDPRAMANYIDEAKALGIRMLGSWTTDRAHGWSDAAAWNENAFGPSLTNMSLSCFRRRLV